jgi:hypothetical protein
LEYDHIKGRMKMYGMKKSCWSIMLVPFGSGGNSRRIPLSKAVIIFLSVVTAMGILGLGRCIYFVGSYGMAKLGMYYDQKENRQLKLKLRFLSKFAQEGCNHVDALISFEDETRLKFGLDQISSDIRKVGVGGKPDPNERLLSSLEDPVVMKADTIKDDILALLRKAKLADTTLGATAATVDRQFDIWSQRPAILPVWGRLTSFFGYRIHPVTGENLFHEGIDISNGIGTPIHATADGVISSVGYKDYFGNVVTVMHPASGYKTVFAHLEKAAVVEGQAVKRGDLIGYLGNSGRSTGPHLHYEIHKLDNIVNPSDYILPTDTMVD